SSMTHNFSLLNTLSALFILKSIDEIKIIYANLPVGPVPTGKFTSNKYPVGTVPIAYLFDVKC
ncbi:MAG: hypothetical protein II699_07110, partial [Lachnospiraceae bacterium]|nr:hypothetical protein [Lachnospiraceae bacterium]